MKKDRAVRIGIVGLGNMGSAHAVNIASEKVKGMELCAVCDNDPLSLANARRHLPECPAFADFEEMFESGLIDSALIAVPHPLHAEIALKAFKNGLNVLVEKPADISVSAALRMNEAASSSGKVFGIMFNQRINPLFSKAREILRSGELGELKRSVWIITNWYRTQSYYDSCAWRATWAGEGGGVLLNQAPHQLDLWQWICGMPSAVSAKLSFGKYHDIEVEDEAEIFVEYKNGATGTFITSTGEYPGTNRLEISASRGKLVLEDGKLKLWKSDSATGDITENSESFSPKIPLEYSEIIQGYDPGHCGILQNFADAVLCGKDLIAPGYDGVKELMISNAAHLSDFKGGEKITLPFDNGEFDRMLGERMKSSKPKLKNGKHSENSYSDRWAVKW